MDNDDFVRQLTRLGLTGYEARVYLALIGRGAFSASEAARQSGIPRQRVYDVLETLVGKGLASLHPGATARYTAEDPQAAIGRLLAAHRNELDEMETGAAEVINRLSPLYQAGQRQTDPLDYIEILRDRGAIGARFDELQASVEREILVFNKPPYATTPQENVSGLPLAQKHVARGMYEYSLFDDLAATEGVRRFINEGEEARFVPELPLKLAILDCTTVMFGMQDPVGDGTDLTIVVVEHASLAIVLKAAFESYWADGQSFDDAYAGAMRSRSAI